MNLVDMISQHAKLVLDFENADLSSDYGYAHLPLCVIDAVFSIGVRYASTAATVERYRRHFDLPPYSALDRQMPANQHTTDDLLKNYYALGVEKMTTDVYQNRQRTSTTSGILKSEAVWRFAAALAKYDIQTIQDLPKAIDNPKLDKAIKDIPGQRSGISLRYFYMLAGSDDFVKPDRMILRFIQAATSKLVKIEEAEKLIIDVSEQLAKTYTSLTPRKLDNLIWSYQRTQ